MNPYKQVRSLERVLSRLRWGSGSPEGAVAAPVGTLYLNESGSATSTLWIKVNGGSSRTGWVAK